jgi:hypothetical protein
MSVLTYKVCEGSTPEELDTSVQEFLDVNYGLHDGPQVVAVIDSNNIITYKYIQAVKLKNE